MVESISNNKGLDVRVDLRNNESIDVEKLAHTLHGNICSERTVYKLEDAALLSSIIGLKLTIFVFLYQICCWEKPWQRAAGHDGRPDDNIWRR